MRDVWYPSCGSQDQHQIVFNLSVPGVHLYGCERLVQKLQTYAGDGLRNILPLDKSWLHANGELFEVDHGDVMRVEREVL